MSENSQIGAHTQGHYVARSESSWMVTFADLLALLLTFFVMLISMNSLHLDRWNALANSMTQQFNPSRTSFSLTPVNDSAEAAQVAPATISLDYLAAVFEEATVRYRAVRGLTVHRLEDRVVISLPSHFLFANDRGDFTAEGGRLIRNLASVLGQLSNEVAIVGHAMPAAGYATGDVIGNPYQRSADWAQGVAVALNRSGFSASITTYGLADLRLGDLPEDLPAILRNSIASRVDIEVWDRVRGLNTAAARNNGDD